ncbi:MAG: hypothetical protein R2911_10730 [Caldilineaceae bacterium]
MVLALQGADGRWGEAAWNRGWNSTMHVLMLLRDFGLDPASAQAQSALQRIRDNVTWQGCGPPECDNNPFFARELEPCINGQVGAAGAYFGQDIAGHHRTAAERQLPDGGWNCEANGSARSSFNTTICVLEALLEYELQFGNRPRGDSGASARAEYLLERLNAFSPQIPPAPVVRATAKAAAPALPAQPSPPGGTMTLLPRARVSAPPLAWQPEERMADAIALVASKRDGDGRWLSARSSIGRDAGGDGCGCGPAEPVDDATRVARVGMVCGGRITQWPRKEDGQQAAMDHKPTKPDQQALANWAAECAEHVLAYFEEQHVYDERPRRP